MKDIFDKMNDYEKESLRAKIILNKPSRAYQVGEQRKLNYDLPSDTKDFRFGKLSQSSEFRVSDCLNHKFEEIEQKDEEFKMTRERERLRYQRIVGRKNARGLL